MLSLRKLWQRFWNWILRRKEPLINHAGQLGETTSSSPSILSHQESSLSASAPSVTKSTASVINEPQFNIHSSDEPRYELWPSILTSREREFFLLLQQVVGNRYQLFVKVRLGDIFKLSNEPENRKFHNNQIQCKHFDFLLCENITYKPLLAIELDDSSHKRLRSQSSDEFKNRISHQAQLKLWRPPIQRTYASRYIQQELERLLS